jgi:hypothetical protein
MTFVLMKRKPSSRVRGFLPKFRHKFAEICHSIAA